MTTPPLPPPFTNLPCAGSVTTSITVWTSDAVEAYGAACAAAERARCLAWVDEALADNAICWPGEIDILREQIVSGRSKA